MDLFGLLSFFKNNEISLYKGFDLLYQICLISRKFKQKEFITAWKLSVLGVILVRIFLHSD